MVAQIEMVAQFYRQYFKTEYLDFLQIERATKKEKFLVFVHVSFPSLVAILLFSFHFLILIVSFSFKLFFPRYLPPKTVTEMGAIKLLN